MKSLCLLRPATVARRLCPSGFVCPKFFTAAVLAAGLVLVPLTARASQIGFSFSGGGMSGSGVITFSNAAVPGVAGAYQITGISGTFSDTVAGFSGAITGLQSIALPSGINNDGTFVPPGTAADGFGFSWDNLFYPGGNSPAVCPPPGPGDPEPPYPFGGGLFDIYGVLFNVQGGYSVDLWSNGVVPGFGLTYGVGDSLNGTVIDTFGEPFSGMTVTVNETPEPSSLVLFGTGLAGLVVTWKRRIHANGMRRA